MKLPVVAIVGRPNTGKSTLFNRLIGRRKAIESPVPGTTRDHISHRISEEKVDYLLIDTGGMGRSDDKDFEEDVLSQSLIALMQADVIIFSIDSRSELTSDDQKVIELLRKKRRHLVPIIIALTKADSQEHMQEAHSSFAELASLTAHLLPLSATQNLGIDALRSTIITCLLERNFGKQPKEVPGTVPKIAIVGRPNVGKSSITNALMPEPIRKRSPMLVSPIAGTTRDAVDTPITIEGKPYILVDTAGLKKQALSLEDLERLSMFRTVQAIETCDICILTLEASRAISQQDKRIASMVMDAGKGLMILLNKIDLLSGADRKQMLEYVEDVFHFAPFARLVPCSALNREGLLKLFPVIDNIMEHRAFRIPTKELHRFLERVVHGQPLGELKSCKHITQADEIPPTFTLFLREPRAVQKSQLKFLENRIRETFGFEGTPIRFITKKIERKDYREK